MRIIENKPKVLILETKSLLAIDATGLRALDDLSTTLAHQGTKFLISGIHKQPLFAIQQSGFLDRLGEDNICGTLSEALERAKTLIGKRESNATKG